MKPGYFQTALIAGLLIFNTSIFAQSRNLLWYDKPAANWNEALPIGNGFIAAMVFGGVRQERLQLNESTIWGGGPNNTVDSAARPYINQVRALLVQKKYLEAQQLANSKLNPTGNSGMPYQLAGNLFINFPGNDNISEYKRDLNIKNATASVTYLYNGVRFKREYFTSFTDNVLMIRLTADKPGSITCNINLQSPLKKAIELINGDLTLSGLGSDHEGQKGKVKFVVIARLKNFGGSFAADTSGIKVRNADTAVVYLSMATNFVNYHDISADPLG
ncbi:MAG: glycoside hydrolase family 95 protein, partial [Bacteroidota bacterium]|nr:glycoside hydrolase family 95 protein [Bacteroidota bacterium]